MEACKTFSDVLSRLELESYFPCELTVKSVFEANLEDNLEFKDIKWDLLKKIINVDSRARDDVLLNISKLIYKPDQDTRQKSTKKQTKTKQTTRKTGQRSRTQTEISLLHPQDVLNAIYLCCSPFLKKLIVSKLFMCRIAVPFIIANKQLSKAFIWPFDFIATNARDSNDKVVEGFLSDQDMKIVSFIRLGKTSLSKSDILNEMLSNDQPFRTFHSRNSNLGSYSNRTFEGIIEATYVPPCWQKKSDSFNDLTLFLNLRGDALQYPLLVDVIKSVSNIVVVLIKTMNLNIENTIAKTLTSIYQPSSTVIIELESDLDGNDEKLEENKEKKEEKEKKLEENMGKGKETKKDEEEEEQQQPENREQQQQDKQKEKKEEKKEIGEEKEEGENLRKEEETKQEEAEEEQQQQQPDQDQDQDQEEEEEEEEETLFDKLQDIADKSSSEFCYIELQSDGNNKVMTHIVKEIKSKIVKCLERSKCQTFSRVRDILGNNGIPCDYSDKECRQGCQLADIMSEKIEAKYATIQTLWIELSILKKKKYREKALNQKRQIENQIQDIRSHQHNLILRLSEMSIALLKNLNDLKDHPERLMFFLNNLKLLLDKRLKKNIPGLMSTNTYLSNLGNKAGSEKHELELKIKKMIDIEYASFGVEHLIREVAQIYEAFTYAKSRNIKECCDVNNLKYIENCPGIAAQLLINGYPLEVMDGAAFNIPLVWIKEVFGCLERELGSTATLLTLSVIGIQSSGKSTLLNAMFGLQLAVSTGRCTKGVFLQLIPLPKDDKRSFQYILVFDTEGLRSNESRELSETHIHDNQLATFAVGVGDITLINIRGENTSVEKEILEIVVHAFIRMKKVHENFNLKQSCIFVHQDVVSDNAGRNLFEGTLQLVKCLDAITNQAAEQEHLPNCHFFKDIIYFDHERHVFLFPNLWRGTPPLCAINPEYSKYVDRLRQFIMSDITERRQSFLSVQQIFSRVNDLWEAILSEDFIFSFRNGIQIKAERTCESKFFELHRKLENTVSQFLLIDAESSFKNCENEDTIEKVKSGITGNLIEKLSSCFENLLKEWTDFIEDAPLRDFMIQWKENRLNQLKMYKDEQHCFSLKEINKMESRTRLEIRQRIILTPKEMENWKYHAKEIVEKCTDHPLDDDIKSAFEQQWSGDLSRFDAEQHTDQLSMEDEIWKIVLNYFLNDTIYLIDELEKFKQQRSMKEFEQKRHLKGCIKENDIGDRHLSGKRFYDSRKIAVTMANDIFLEIDIFVRDRENKRFNIAEIREIFDNFIRTYEKCDKLAYDFKFTFSKNFKAMLAVYIWKSLASIYQRLHEDYEKVHGLEIQRINYKTTLLNNFRTLISEAMQVKTRKINERKEEEASRKKSSDKGKRKKFDEEQRRKKFDEEERRKKADEEKKREKADKEEKVNIINGRKYRTEKHTNNS